MKITKKYLINKLLEIDEKLAILEINEVEDNYSELWSQYKNIQNKLINREYEDEKR